MGSQNIDNSKGISYTIGIPLLAFRIPEMIVFYNSKSYCLTRQKRYEAFKEAVETDPQDQTQVLKSLCQVMLEGLIEPKAVIYAKRLEQATDFRVLAVDMARELLIA